jgi:hypothetical protein
MTTINVRRVLWWEHLPARGADAVRLLQPGLAYEAHAGSVLIVSSDERVVTFLSGSSIAHREFYDASMDVAKIQSFAHSVGVHLTGLEDLRLSADTFVMTSTRTSIGKRTMEWSDEDDANELVVCAATGRMLVVRSCHAHLVGFDDRDLIPVMTTDDEIRWFRASVLRKRRMLVVPRLAKALCPRGEKICWCERQHLVRATLPSVGDHHVEFVGSYPVVFRVDELDERGAWGVVVTT